MEPRFFSRAEKTIIVGLIVLLGFIAALIFHYVQGVILMRPYPYNTFLFRPEDRMADWEGAFQFVWDLDPFHSTYRGQGNNYPPVGYLISVPFTIWGFMAGKWIFATCFIAGWLWFCWRYIARQIQSRILRPLILLIFGFLTYPFLFAIDRMNAENSLFLIFLAFFVLWTAGKTKSAAIFLGVAAAAKVYPGMAAVLYIRQKRFLEAGICILAAIISTGVALLIFRTGPAEMLEAYRISAPGFHQMIWNNSIVQHSSSWYAAVRLFQTFFLNYDSLPFEARRALIDSSLHYFSLFLLLPLLLLLVCSVSKRLASWELLLAAVAAMLLFTPVSYDYKLLYLIFPFALFLRSETGRVTGLLFSVIFGLLFIPKTYFVLVDDVTSNVVINVALLTLTFVWISLKAILGFWPYGGPARSSFTSP